MKRIFCLILVFVSLFALVSCSSKKKKEETLKIEEEISQEISAEEGGKIENSDKSISIEVPGEALESNTKITMKIYDAGKYIGTEGKDFISKVVEFEPSGIIFKKPVIITMTSLKDVENKIISAAVYRDEKGEWSYSKRGAYVILTGRDEGGDPIMQSAGGDPIMLNAGGDPIMIPEDGGDPIMLSAGGDPIMVKAGGDPIMHDDGGDPIMNAAGGDPIMNAAGGDPIMMTTGHFTAYGFIALDPKEVEAVENPDKDDEASDEDIIHDSDSVSPKVVCTGQTSCYDANGEEIDCPAEGEDFYGQDAQYAALGKCVPQSFTIDDSVEGEPVVLDNNTTLQWLQSPTKDAVYNREDAVTYCNDLVYAGHDDWRLPTPNELLMIVDNSRSDPAMYTDYFMVTGVYIWTSKPAVDLENYPGLSNETVKECEWIFDFHSGSVSCMGINGGYVYCVRGQELSKSVFETSSVGEDEIVTDTTTGLVWQKSYVSKTWQEALSYCENLEYAGFSDWRLPNKNELITLLNFDKEAPNPLSDFPGMPFGDALWSSSVFMKVPWVVSFDITVLHGYETTKDRSVRCVR